MVEAHLICDGCHYYQCWKFHGQGSPSHNFETVNTFTNSRVKYNDDRHKMLFDNFDLLNVDDSNEDTFM